MLKYILKIIIILVLIASWAPVGCKASDSFVPWNFNTSEGPKVGVRATNAPDGNHRAISLLSRVVMDGLSFFSEYISKVDGDRCPMYPTCASYSRQVVHKHGFFVGIVMTADRLIHEGNETDYAPLVRAGTRIRYYDPVHWNDYWWFDEKKNIDKQ